MNKDQAIADYFWIKRKRKLVASGIAMWGPEIKEGWDDAIAVRIIEDLQRENRRLKTQLNEKEKS